ISKCVVYNPYAVHFGTTEGNRFLLDEIAGDPDLIPQFIVNFATDELAEVETLAREAGVRSLRVCPVTQRYPLVHWSADRWLEWRAGRGLWLGTQRGHPAEVDVRDLSETARRHPRVPVVLAGSHYSNYAVVWPLVRALPNIHLALSRFDILHGVQRLIRHIGV